MRRKGSSRGSRRLGSTVLLVLALSAGCGRVEQLQRGDSSAVSTEGSAGAPQSSAAAPSAAAPATPARTDSPGGSGGTPPDQVAVGMPHGARNPDAPPGAPGEPDEPRSPGDVFCRSVFQLGPDSGNPRSNVYRGVSWDGHAFVATDAAGNIAIVASFQGRIDLGGGTLDTRGVEWSLLVAKYDPHCRHLWSHSYGSPTARVEGGPIAFDAQGELVFGGTLIGSADFGAGEVSSVDRNPNGFLVKLRADGTARFSKVFSSAESSYVYSLAIDDAGNIVIWTFAAHDTAFGGPPLDNWGDFAVKFAPDGAHVWTRRLADAISDAQLGTTPAGDVLLVGSSLDPLDWGDGSPALPSGDWLYSLNLLDADGAHRWSTPIYSGDGSWGWGLAFTRSGDVVATYGTAPTSAMTTTRVIQRIDSGGNRLPTVSWDSSGDQSHSWDLAVDSRGQTIELGEFRFPLTLGGRTFTPKSLSDLYVAKRDLEGGVIWAAQESAASSSRSSDGLGITIDREDHVIALWYTTDQLQPEPGELVLVKFAP